MRLRPHRRNLVVWSSTAGAVGRSRAVPRRRGARPARIRRIRRIRWWFRVGALLMILGALWLARTARIRWELVSLLAGLLIIGFALRAASWAFLLGSLALIVTLLKRDKRATPPPPSSPDGPTPEPPAFTAEDASA